MDRQTDGRTDDVITIGHPHFSMRGLTDRRTDRQCDYYRVPAFLNAGP